MVERTELITPDGAPLVSYIHDRPIIVNNCPAEITDLELTPLGHVKLPEERSIKKDYERGS